MFSDKRKERDMEKLKTIIMPHGLNKKLREITGASETSVTNALRGAYRTELAMRIRKEAIALGGMYARETKK